MPFIEPQTLPHAVPQHEPAVIDGNLGLVLRHNAPVDVDLDRLVPGVLLRLMGSDMIRH